MVINTWIYFLWIVYICQTLYLLKHQPPRLLLPLLQNLLRSLKSRGIFQMRREPNDLPG